jgi:hypothetical protein
MRRWQPGQKPPVSCHGFSLSLLVTVFLPLHWSGFLFSTPLSFIIPLLVPQIKRCCPLTPETHHLIDADAIAQIVITGHQTFFTAEALTNIAETTLANIDAFESGSGTMHRVVNAKLD